MGVVQASVPHSPKLPWQHIECLAESFSSCDLGTHHLVNAQAPGLGSWEWARHPIPNTHLKPLCQNRLVLPSEGQLGQKMAKSWAVLNFPDACKLGGLPRLAPPRGKSVCVEPGHAALLVSFYHYDKISVSDYL